MNLADVQSPEWRARAAARVSKKLLGFTQGATHKSPILIAGLQRSGTTMLSNIFHLHSDTEMFDEARASKTFADFRIRSLEVVKQVISESHYRFPCFKVIADSHILPSIMRALPDAKVVWMYRDAAANASSRLKKFPHATAAIRAVCEGKPGGGWFAEGVSPAVLRTLQALDRSRFSEFDYACLVWWVRNQLFFDLGLDREARVRLLRYETLVVDPAWTMRGLYEWLDMPWSASSMRFVHARSLHSPNQPPLDPQLAPLCGNLLQRLDDLHDRQWQKPPVSPETRADLRRAS